MMINVIVNVVGDDSFTFKNPKRHGLVEEIKGQPVYIVEEDDGIVTSVHRFVWSNVTCVSEKKHKGEA